MENACERANERVGGVYVVHACLGVYCVRIFSRSAQFHLIVKTGVLRILHMRGEEGQASRLAHREGRRNGKHIQSLHPFGCTGRTGQPRGLETILHQTMWR